MATENKPVTAIDFIWRAVRDARWTGYEANGLVSSVFSIYMGWHIPYVAKRNEESLRLQLPTEKVKEFQKAFPEAVPDDQYRALHGLTILTLPIPFNVQRVDDPVEASLKGNR